jgi:hypothetical protein
MFSLIANTGIQFYTKEFKLPENINYKLSFHEWFDTSQNQLRLELTHFFSNEEIWVRKKDLNLYGYLKSGEPTEDWDKIKNEIEELDTEVGYFYTKSLKNLNIINFLNKWIPLPYFELNNQGKNFFGPTNWCRAKISLKNEFENIYEIVLAFDTKSLYDEDNLGSKYNEQPEFSNSFSSVGKKFKLCRDEFLLIDFLSKAKNCEWVDKYILKIMHGIDNANKLKEPKLDYLASFVTFLNLLEKVADLPTITLHKDRNVVWGNVDLAIDIGNSKTSAVLFEEGDFTKVRMLELQNFSKPSEIYSEPFDMRLAFKEVNFGEFGLINSEQFTYPSFVRLGNEAKSLIYKAINDNDGKDQRTSFSSPKRYLWDDRAYEGEWEFIQENEDLRKPIWLDGISQQFNKDGSLNLNFSGGQSSSYSPKSLMTFAFLEIFSQARIQINSFKYRDEIGDTSKPRKINRIIITCPTAMSRVEQMALRKAAEEAAIVLNKFNKSTKISVSYKDESSNIKIVPSPKGNLNQSEARDWIYDEATSVQFLYLYSEISKRYLNNTKEYFEYFGKKRKEDTKKSLIIGSLDIGAGTSDLMICKYLYDNKEKATLTPEPIFWDSFYFAGDDLLKEFIKQFIIEGSKTSLKSILEAKGFDDVNALLFGFFGEDHSSKTYKQRQLRRDFNIQVSIPIALKYLELTQLNYPKTNLKFDDIFKNENKPSDKVIEFFKDYFGFDLKEISWDFSIVETNKLINKLFAPLLQKVASLMYAFDCDFVLLSGRPTTLQEIEKLFLKFYSVSPNRLISMSNYRVGKWYPFQDGNGYFKDQKTIVGIGAIIGNIASEQGGLNGFNLNLTTLKKSLIPTTELFGVMDQITSRVEDVLISPTKNETEVLSSSLPIYIGTRQINSISYPSRTFYSLDIDKTSIKEFFINKGESDINKLKELVDLEISKINKSKPLKFHISRESYHEDNEKLILNSVENSEGQELRLKNFRLQIQSINEGNNSWLDTGEFKLGVNSRR